MTRRASWFFLAVATAVLLYMLAPRIQQIDLKRFRSNASLAGPKPPLKEAWRVSRNSRLSDLHIVNGLLVTPTRKALKAFDPANGKQIWSNSRITGPVGINGGTAYDSEDGGIRSIDLSTGRVKWRWGEWIVPGGDPVEARGRVFIGGQGDAAVGLFVALDEKTGRLRWSLKTPMPVSTEPVVVRNMVIFGTMDDWKGRYSALLVAANIKTGREQWVTPSSGSILTPVVRKKALFVATRGENRINKIDLKTGEQIWAFGVGGEVNFRPALAKDLVVVATADGIVKAFKTNDGKVRWTARIGGPTAQPPVAADGLVYLARGGKKPAIVVVDAEKGAIISTYDLRAAPTTGVLIDNGRLFVGIGDSDLIALEGK